MRSFISMNQTEKPETFYKNRINELKQALQKLYSKRSVLGWLRLSVIAVMIISVYYSWHAQSIIIESIIAAGIALFLFLISKDADNKGALENFETLLSINKAELDNASGNYFNQYDGKNLEPEHHVYASDLDLFGKASLYQYINRCNAEKARALLAERLTHIAAKNR